MRRTGRPQDPRELAHDVTRRILYHRAYADIALGSALAKSLLTPQDRRLATELVYGTIRRLLTIDWALDGILKRPISSAHPDLATALRVGGYQLMYLDRVPDYAVVSSAVRIVREKAGEREAGVANAVLRRLARDGSRPLPPWDDPVKRLSIEHSHPFWLVEHLLSRHRSDVDEVARILAANNVPPPLQIWVNSLRTDRTALAESLAREGYVTRPTRFFPNGLVVESGGRPLEDSQAFRKGLFYVMDEAAMIAASALGVTPGSVVLDACAAPGGKTACLAAHMENRGRILAVEANEARRQLIEQNCQRLGVTIVETRLADVRDISDWGSTTFDFVLADVPCSGLGVLRRRPDLRWRTSPERIQRLRNLQAEILEAVARSIKRGGTLLYCTCSIHPDENAGIIDGFLEHNRDFRRSGLKGLVPPELEPEEVDGTLQMFTHIHGTDGFFIARITRVS